MLATTSRYFFLASLLRFYRMETGGTKVLNLNQFTLSLVNRFHSNRKKEKHTDRANDKNTEKNENVNVKM